MFFHSYISLPEASYLGTGDADTLGQRNHNRHSQSEAFLLSHYQHSPDLSLIGVYEVGYTSIYHDIPPGNGTMFLMTPRSSLVAAIVYGRVDPRPGRSKTFTTDRDHPLWPCPLRVVSNFVRHSCHISYY